MVVSESEIKKYSRSKKDIQIFKGGKNNIIYPIFTECIRHTTDEFWKNLFEDLSMGKCPKSIYISGNTIYSANKKRGFSYIIPTDGSKTSSEVFTEVREILINNTSICSSIDISIRKEEMKEKSDDEVTNKTTWSEIRKKNLREIFIINFVIRMRKKYKLSWDSARHLYSIIQLGFIYKTQSSKDVTFKNKRIERIEGIVYREDLKMFINEFDKNEQSNDKDEVEDKDNYLYYYWDRYVYSTVKIF